MKVLAPSPLPLRRLHHIENKGETKLPQRGKISSHVNNSLPVVGCVVDSMQKIILRHVLSVLVRSFRYFAYKSFRSALWKYFLSSVGYLLVPCTWSEGLNLCIMRRWPISVTVRPKAWVCCRLIGGIETAWLLCVGQVAASATSWSLVQGSSTGFVCVSNCVWDIEISKWTGIVQSV